MTIASELTALQTDITNARTAITNKGGTVTSGGGSSQLSTDIATIPSGGGMPSGMTKFDSGSITYAEMDKWSGYVSHFIYHNLGEMPKYIYMWYEEAEVETDYFNLCAMYTSLIDDVKSDDGYSGATLLLHNNAIEWYRTASLNCGIKTPSDTRFYFQLDRTRVSQTQPLHWIAWV